MTVSRSSYVPAFLGLNRSSEVSWLRAIRDRSLIPRSQIPDPQMITAEGVVDFYDTHPINEHEILNKLAAKGIALDGLTENELKEFDQDHYGGFEATDALATAADIRAEHRVLDVCSGMGGPARYVAYRTGCRATGIDLTTSRVEGARRLTEMVGPRRSRRLRPGRRDAHAVSGCVVRSRLRPGSLGAHRRQGGARRRNCSRARTRRRPRLHRHRLDRAADRRGEREARRRDAVSADRDRAALSRRAVPRRIHDRPSRRLSAEWKGILVARIEMYRSLRDTTIAKFGEAHYEKWDRKYAAFVGLYAADKLGGGRFVATRAR